MRIKLICSDWWRSRYYLSVFWSEYGNEGVRRVQITMTSVTIGWLNQSRCHCGPRFRPTDGQKSPSSSWSQTQFHLSQDETQTYILIPSWINTCKMYMSYHDSFFNWINHNVKLANHRSSKLVETKPSYWNTLLGSHWKLKLIPNFKKGRTITSR